MKMSLNRSMLLVSGNSPKRLQDAAVFNPGLLVLDLADEVKDEDKDSARLLVREAIRFLDYEKVKLAVRINTLKSGFGTKDIEVISRVKPEAFLIPQASVEQLQDVEIMLALAEKEGALESGGIKLIPVIETVKALDGISSILSVSSRIVGAFFNADGLAKELGMTRTQEGDEILYARSKVAIACRAAGLNSFDTVFTESNDEEGLLKDARKARNLGFSGKAAINGRQIEIINHVFA